MQNELYYSKLLFIEWWKWRNKKIIKSHHAKKSAGENVSDEDLAIRISKVRKNALIKIKNFAEYIKNDPESINNTIIFVYSKEEADKFRKFLKVK